MIKDETKRIKGYLRFACTLAAVLLLGAAAGCAPTAPALEQTATLPPGSIINVTNSRGNVSIYAPAHGESTSAFTLDASGRSARRDVVVRKAGNRITVSTLGLGSDLLLRGPKDSVIDVRAVDGNITAADVDGVVNANTDRGDIKMLLPQYGTARAGTGNVSVIFAGTAWAGTLHFSTGKGDVELYVNQNASARVHLLALHGTIFTDFPLKGTARGTSEEIDGALNGGAKRAIDVLVRDGSIRLLQLKPQM